MSRGGSSPSTHHRQLKEMLEKKKLISWLYVIPVIVILISLIIFPLLYSLYLSFSQWDMTSFGAEPHFIGIGNFAQIFTDRRFFYDLGRTAVVVIGALIVETLLGFGVALLLNRKFKGRGILLAAFLMPVMVSEVTAGLIWGLIFDATFGPLNQIIAMLHLAKKPIVWLVDHPLLSVIIADIWQWSPFIMLITMAGLRALPPSPYEAAMLDGASGWQILKFITLPLITPILGVAVVLRSMDLIKMFGKIYMLTKGGPGTASETITYYIYLQAFSFWNLPYAAALSFILLAIVTFFITYFFKMITVEE
ncbi:sugar ABC transporter permease [Candidatus Aerophobetes bacterium]|nr:sugar ABC transporter permease [Candidatus Aerophobetes bacterium]